MKKEYLAALASPQWQKKRLEIMQRDNFTCQFCGCKDRTLHIHHKVYEKGKKPWEYEDKDLITLCDRCHEYITDEKNSLYENFTNTRDCFRKFGFSDSIFNAILCGFCSFFESIKEQEKHWNFVITKQEIHNAVMSTQNYDDVKTLVKLGIKEKELVNFNYPIFLEDYDNAKIDENVSLLLND